MKLFIFFLPALFLMAGCATLKDKGLEPNYEVFVQKSLTKLSESDLFNYSDSINLNWDETDFGFFIKGEFERISIENALAEMRGKNWSGKPIFKKEKISLVRQLIFSFQIWLNMYPQIIAIRF